ncbi:MAG: leucyl aminopeptidase family protein, partial [Pseudomonadota bacterium]
MTLAFAAHDPDAIPVHLLAEEEVQSWLETQDDSVQAWAKAHGFTGGIGQAITFPSETGIAMAAVGYGNVKSRTRARFHLAAGAARLPKGTYTLHSTLDTPDLEVEALGWLLAGYRFDRYKAQSTMGANLIAPAGIDAAQVEAMAQGEA